MDLYEETLERSRELPGGMGGITFAVLTGLHWGGCPQEEIDQVEELLLRHFPRLESDLCNTLCRMVATRLGQDVRTDGRWY